jgi:hypothetical protein
MKERIDLAAAVGARDLRLFDLVPTATTPDDRRSLLELQNVVALKVPSYTYLEVGSYLGGSLVPHLVDERCGVVVSIDPHPPSQPDVRGRQIENNDVTTAVMVKVLTRAIGEKPLGKLLTYEVDARDAMLTGTLPTFDLAFIDGEHTNVAVASDFLSVMHVAKANSIIAFHDANLIHPALLIVEKILADRGVPFVSSFLKTNVFALGLGDMMDAVRSLPGQIDRGKLISQAEADLLRKHFKARIRKFFGQR